MPVIANTRQIGAILATSRKFHKLTQAQVASRLGLSQNRLSVLESKPETLTAQQLITVLNVLGLEMRIEERNTSRPKVEW